MAEAERHGGPIDPYSPYDLYDVVNGDIPAADEVERGESVGTEFFGYHLIHTQNGEYMIQYDGHVGTVDTFHEDDFDDVLELVAYMVDLLIEGAQHQHDDVFHKFAGPYATSDKEKAEQEPDKYQHIPDPS